MLFDTTIIAAIITSVVTILAAVLGALIQRRPIENQNSGETKYLSRLPFLNRSYSILERERDGKIVAIPNGLSIFAGVFHIIWAIFHGLWAVILGWVLVLLLFFTNAWAMCHFGNVCFIFNATEYLIVAIQVGIPLYFLWFGNRLRVQKMTISSNLLSTSHFNEVAVMYAKSKFYAIERYADTRGL